MMADQMIALKEWAVVCAALAAGRQLVLFRKGGIHEGPEGFQPEHDEFWLFPTGFHQSAAGVVESFASEAAEVLGGPPGTEAIPIQHYGRISDLFWVAERERLEALRPYHVLTQTLLEQRFEYHRPGLFVLVVETWSLPAPRVILADPRYDGCRSWVRLNSPLPTSGLTRCLSEGVFQQQRSEIVKSLRS